MGRKQWSERSSESAQIHPGSCRQVQSVDSSVSGFRWSSGTLTSSIHITRTLKAVEGDDVLEFRFILFHACNISYHEIARDPLRYMLLSLSEQIAGPVQDDE